MKKIQLIGVGLGLTFFIAAAVAQDDDEPQMFTYATYFYCNVNDQGKVDEIATRDAPIMDDLVDTGVISGWGWLAHHTGGQWRRIRYSTADSLQGLFDAQDKISAAFVEKYGEDDSANDVMGAACPRHDDYVWQIENGNVGQDRGKVGFSVYHVCDINREERADEIVAEHIAPILDKFVEEGKLTSWGWLSHVIGGRFRRLQTMTAPDLSALLQARTDAITAIYAEDSEVGEEFSEICGPHVDYIWDIQHQKAK